MSDQHIELFVKYVAGGDEEHVRKWLADHGLASDPMQAGHLLVSGGSDQVEKAFGVTLEGRSRPFDVPVPDELKPYVESITIPRSRKFYS